MRSQLTVSLTLRQQHETLTVPDVTGVHTLDTDDFSTQLVGYFFSNSLTTVVHDDD